MPINSTANTIRILVATDSHVGYQERDPIRKDDSWKSFDEVMQLAKAQDVDMILLAGDLFHENKPSRKSMYQVMRSLRLNCLGDKPCELEFLSNASDVFDRAFSHVNYEDPNINVAIPAFSIHGNHDDPTGDGHFSSLDLLQVSGLVNYFGRIPESDKIEIKPVLLQKGQTKLALYGMSNVRDERLFRTFRDGNVKFFKPAVHQRDWFNLMAVHQNHYAHSETNYLPENFLPEFMDLVIWGHEHECLIDPRLNPETQFHVMQPGSSVATSLVPGEAVAKHVAVISITGKEFKVEKHRIKSVRPFVTKDLVLQSDSRFKKLAKIKDNRSLLTQELEKIVDELIVEAKNDWISAQDEEVSLEDVPLPLVRLKVEYSAPDGCKFECENPQRFSNRFLNKVANVNDVAHFYRKTKITRSVNLQKQTLDAAVLEAMEGDSVKVGRLVHEFLTAQSLKIIPGAEFGDAITQYVEKGDIHAIETFVSESLTLQVKELLALGEDGDIEDQMDRFRAKRENIFAAGLLKRSKGKQNAIPHPANWDSNEQGEWADQPAAVISGDDNDTPAALTKKKGKTSSGFSDDDNGLVMPGLGRKTAAKKAPAKRKPAKSRTIAKLQAPAKAPARGWKKQVEPSDDESDEEMIMLDNIPSKPQPRRAATASRQTQLNFMSQSQLTTQTGRELSDDEISDDAFEPAPRIGAKR